MARRSNRLTMREAILYQLIKNHEQGDQYVGLIPLQGDVYCPELNKAGWVSHEVSARLSELRKGNPGLLEIEKRKAKHSGATYYAYRLNPAFTPSLIKDPDLEQFARKVWSGTARPAPQREYVYDDATRTMIEVIT